MAQCSHLTELNLSFSGLYLVYFCPALSSPSLSAHLRTLSLTYIWAGTPTHGQPVRDASNAAFSSLKQLHTLHLARVFHIDFMLPSLAHAPALRHVTVRPVMDGMPAWPTPSPLAHLLAAKPELTVALISELAPNESKPVRMALRDAARALDRLRSSSEMKPFIQRVFRRQQKAV